MAKSEVGNDRRRGLLPRQGDFRALVKPFYCPEDLTDLLHHVVGKAGHSPAMPALRLLVMKQIASNLERAFNRS